MESSGGTPPKVQGRTMRRIAVINQKGGVGKTTTTAHLGAAFALRGKSVLLIDLDPQGNLTLHFGSQVQDDQSSVYDVLTSSVPIGDVVQRPRERITLVPADIDLAAAEAELVSVMGREVLLRESLTPMAESFDLMLIDCPPSLGVLTINALAACDEVLIPLQPQFFALQGLGQLLQTVTLVRQRINPLLRVCGVVLCMHEPGTRLASEVSDDLSKFLQSGRGSTSAWSGASVFSTYIRRNIKLAESSGFGQTVFDYAPTCHGAEDYSRLAAEILAEVATKPVARKPKASTNGRAAHPSNKELPDSTERSAVNANPVAVPPPGASTDSARTAQTSAAEEKRPRKKKSAHGTNEKPKNIESVITPAPVAPPIPRKILARPKAPPIKPESKLTSTPVATPVATQAPPPPPTAPKPRRSVRRVEPVSDIAAVAVVS